MIKYIIEQVNQGITDLTPDISSNTAYSSTELNFLKVNYRQNEIIKELKEDYEYTDKKIQDISQWMFPLAQMSLIYKTINVNEKLLMKEGISIQNAQESLTVYISEFIRKLKYAKIDTNRIRRSNFSGELFEEKGIKELLLIIKDYSKEYTYLKDDKNITKQMDVLNNKKLKDNFLSIIMYLTQLYKNNSEILILISEVRDVLEKDNETILLEEERQAHGQTKDSLHVKTIIGQLTDIKHNWSLEEIEFLKSMIEKLENNNIDVLLQRIIDSQNTDDMSKKEKIELRKTINNKLKTLMGDEVKNNEAMTGSIKK